MATKQQQNRKNALVVSAVVIASVVLLLIYPGSFAQLKQKGSLRTLTIVPILPVEEPLTSKSCNDLGGILILPEQDCQEGFISWGYGKIGELDRQCCIMDRCLETKGKFVTEYNKQNDRFERRCICLEGYEYLIKTGCTRKYG